MTFNLSPQVYSHPSVACNGTGSADASTCLVDLNSPFAGDEKVGDGVACYGIFRMPHVSRHTSHVTRHTSHVTRHTPHATNHTPQSTSHSPHVTNLQEWRMMYGLDFNPSNNALYNSSSLLTPPSSPSSSHLAPDTPLMITVACISSTAVPLHHRHGIPKYCNGSGLMFIYRMCFKHTPSARGLTV